MVLEWRMEFFENGAKGAARGRVGGTRLAGVRWVTTGVPQFGLCVGGYGTVGTTL